MRAHFWKVFFFIDKGAQEGGERLSKTSGGVNGDTTENVEMGFTVGCDNWSEWAVAESRGNRTIEWLQMHPHSRTVRRTIPAASQLLGCRQALYRPFMEK